VAGANVGIVVTFTSTAKAAPAGSSPVAFSILRVGEDEYLTMNKSPVG
jgi:hypothetical protein